MVTNKQVKKPLKEPCQDGRRNNGGHSTKGGAGKRGRKPLGEDRVPKTINVLPLTLRSIARLTQLWDSTQGRAVDRAVAQAVAAAVAAEQKYLSQAEK